MLTTTSRSSLLPPDRILVATVNGEKVHIGFEYIGSQPSPWRFAISLDGTYWRIVDVRTSVAYPGDAVWMATFNTTDDTQRLKAVVELLRQRQHTVSANFFSSIAGAPAALPVGGR